MRALIVLTLLLASCASNELPTAGTMESGDTVRTPKQYEEFCERDVNDLCPEEDDADIN